MQAESDEKTIFVILIAYKIFSGLIKNDATVPIKQ